jgi:hypothetical protein
MMSATATVEKPATYNGRPIIWSPTPKQAEFLSAPQREVLFGGSLGAGKSDCLLMAACSQTQNKFHRAIIFRRSFPQARDLIARSHELFVPLGAIYNEQKSTWTFPSGAKVEFGFLDSPEDRLRFLGRQFSAILFDELTTWPADSEDASGEPVNASYLFMQSRLRAAQGSGLRLEIRATATANGVGFHWVKQRFGIDDDGGPSMRRDPITGYHRRFIPARLSDNPHLRGGEYEQGLRGMPATSRAALIEGRWDQTEGAMFEGWRRSTPEGRPWHVCEPFDIPVGWPLWRGADDGFAAPFSCHWLTQNPESKTYFVIDELYGTQMLATEIAERVKEKDFGIVLTDHLGAEYFNNRVLKGVIDSAAFANTGAAAVTRGEQLNQLGCKFIPVQKFPGSRIARIKNFHQLLAPNSKSPGATPSQPGIVFFSTCKNAIRTIPSLQRDQNNPEDIDTDGEDHAFDSICYALEYRKPSGGTRRVVGI